MMTRMARRSAARATLTRDCSAKPGGTPDGCAPGMLTLDGLLAEPMVQQLMCRDRTDEAAGRRLCERVAANWPAMTPCRRRPLPVAPDEFGYLLHETARLWDRRCERAVHARLADITCARCAVLLKLEHSGGLNQVTLAHSLDIAPITLVRLLDRLEAAGLVSRLPDPHDRRAYLLTLTAKAQPLIARIHDIVRTIQSEARLGLSDIETKQLHALLGRIRSNLLIRMNRPRSADPALDSEHA
jgi:MarR family transcriptional regulator for hemolysin